MIAIYRDIHRIPAQGTIRPWRGLVALALIHLLAIQSLPAQPSETSSVEPPHRIQLGPSRPNQRNSGNRWYPGPVSTVEGRVVQFDGEQLAIELPGETTPTRYAASRVIEIETRRRPKDQTTAIQQFEQRRYSEALRGLIRSISERKPEDRPPVWQQQWLSMVASQAAMRSGQGKISLELVKQLDARPLPPLMLGMLPVDWPGDLPADSPLIETAVNQASSPSPAVKLVAASWLLRSPQYREAATDALRRLSRQSERRSIALLAGQLLWRTKSPPEIQSELQQWERELAELPMSMQTGPMISLERGVRRAGIGDAARKWSLILEMAPATWHPDLKAVTP